MIKFSVVGKISPVSYFESMLWLIPVCICTLICVYSFNSRIFFIFFILSPYSYNTYFILDSNIFYEYNIVIKNKI